MQEPEEESEGVKSVHRRAGMLLVDSGAGDHFCHPEFAREPPSKKEHKIDVAGCARQHIISPWNTPCQPDGENESRQLKLTNRQAHS